MSTAAVKSAILGITDRIAAQRESCQAVISVGGGTFWTRVDACGDVDFENAVKGSDVAAVDTNVANYEAGSLYGPMLRKIDTYCRGLSISNLDQYCVTHKFRMAESAASIYNSALSKQPVAQAVFPRNTRSLATFIKSGAADVFSPTTGVPSTTYGPAMIEVLVNSIGGAPVDIFNIGLYQIATPSTVKQISVDLTGAGVGSKVALGQQALISALASAGTVIAVATTGQFSVNDWVMLRSAGATELAKVTSIAANSLIYLASPCEEAFAIGALIVPMFYMVATIAPVSGVVSGDYITVRPIHDREPAH